MSVSLNTIVINNFKSYVGKHKVGPIREFTVIVGQNGSGKSNIIDAIRFALGEDANGLRVKHLSELKSREAFITDPKEDPYVNLIFKMDDGTLMNFKRQIHGEISQYEIDDKIVMNEIYIMELQDRCLDIKAGNFFIPQGYIEHFAMQTPKDLTTMFEVINNSIVYKADYERLKLKLFEAGEVVFYKNQIKKKILTERKNASIEKTEKEKYIKLEKQYNKQKFKFQLIQLLLINKKVEFLQSEEKEIQSQTEKYLFNKKNAILQKKSTDLQFKSLSSSLESIEQRILEKKNIIQQRKLEFINFEQGVLHWQKKRDCARVSLDSASKAHDSKKRIIQELNTELKQIDKKLTELKKASQTNIIELSNSQVKRYMELTNEAECRAKDFMKQINLMRNQQEAHNNKLDNENRRKQELEDKIKQRRLMIENLEMRLKKLEDSNAKYKAMIIEKTEKKSELNQKITETSNKSFSLEKNIEDISEKLSQADFDNNTILRLIKKNETIKMLKQLYSGVHGRLSDLCKPIHSRYTVAVIKVFGKNMNAIVVDSKRTAIQCIQFLKEQKIGIEIFLPLDVIKKIFLQQHLRTIKDPKNVKLLYDVLKISSTEIDKAVLFVTKNTLVCETIEDARKIAHESDDKQKSHDCVSLDGSFFRKAGIISGGQVDLITKGKQWEEQEILILQEKKTQLMQEFRNLPQISLLQYELDIINVQIDGLAINKYIVKDIKDTENEIINLQEELDILDEEIIALNVTISKIQDNIQTRLEKIKNLENRINAIKDEIFVDFCKEINVPNISHYEKNNLQIYQEKERQMEFEEQYDRIKNQLRFENEIDTESKMSKWKHTLQHVDVKLDEVRQQEHRAKIKIEQEKIEMSKLEDNYTNIEKDLENIKKTLTQHETQIRVSGELYVESQKAHIAVQREIEQQKIKCSTILKECKMKDFTIPMLETTVERRRRLEESFSTTSSSSMAESSESYEVLAKIDFSQFPENICNCTEEELQDMAKQLNEKLTKIQNAFADIVKPNLKVDEKILLIEQNIEKINADLPICRNEYNKIKEEFKSVKEQRNKQFSNCFDNVAVEIDFIYKNLVKDTRAQAIILSDNPEEPYAGNIIYNCIVPSKSLQPLQCLSGGEKSLASLALLFAIQRYKKMPFFIMDEIDASLDNENIKNVIRFIESQRNSTYIMITLHKELYYNKTDTLVGVVSIEHEDSCSKVFAITLNDYKKYIFKKK